MWWISACLRICTIKLSWSDQSSAESLSRNVLLSHSLSSCSSIAKPERLNLFQNLEYIGQNILLSEYPAASLFIAQGWTYQVSEWWIPSSKGWVDMVDNRYGIKAMAFTCRSSLDSNINRYIVWWTTCIKECCVWKMTLCVCRQPQIQSILEQNNILGRKQNKSFKGNVKWVYMVQKHARTGIICE